MDFSTVIIAWLAIMTVLKSMIPHAPPAPPRPLHCRAVSMKDVIVKTECEIFSSPAVSYAGYGRRAGYEALGWHFFHNLS